MRRVVPSQVVEYMRCVLPPAVFERAHEDNDLLRLGSERATALDGLLEMVQAIPDELLPPDAEQLENLLFAISAIRFRLRRWQTGDGVARGRCR